MAEFLIHFSTRRERGGGLKGVFGQEGVERMPRDSITTLGLDSTANFMLIIGRQLLCLKTFF